MIRTCTFHIPVREWFPQDDPIAPIMARLLVAREDLYLEMQGMSVEAISVLDECSSDWRKIYFFRNCSRTLMEIKSAIHALKQKKEFLRDLSRQSRFNDGYEKLVAAMEKAAHLKDGAFEEALGKIDPDTKILFQGGNRAKDIHYKFALEFIGAIILCHAYADPEPEWNRILKATMEVCFSAVKAIDMLFMAYAEQRGFLNISNVRSE